MLGVTFSDSPTGSILVETTGRKQIVHAALKGPDWHRRPERFLQKNGYRGPRLRREAAPVEQVERIIAMLKAGLQPRRVYDRRPPGHDCRLARGDVTMRVRPWD